jgi:hypothetical protein
LKRGGALATPDWAFSIALTFLFMVGALGSALAAPAKTTVIHAKVWSTHDRVTPPEVKDQIVLEDFTFRLSGANDVQEDYTYGVISDADHPVVRLPPFHASGSMALGIDGGKVVWKVTGPHSLRRVNQGLQQIKIMDFDIQPNGQCRLDVRWLLEKGQQYLKAVRQDGGGIGEFTLSKLIRTECSVE